MLNIGEADKNFETSKKEHQDKVRLTKEDKSKGRHDTAENEYRVDMEALSNMHVYSIQKIKIM